MKREILRIQNVSKINDNKRILNNLHMNLYEGDVLGVVGLHDSGKSLLLNVLNGEEGWDYGRIFYEEEEINWAQLKKSSKIRLIKNESTLVSTLSILENIFIIRKHLHFKSFIRWNLLKRQLVQFFKDLDINIDFNRKVFDLSLSEQHLIEIVQAYILGAKLILIDNVYNSYTNEEHNTLQSLILKLKKRNVSFIISGNQIAMLQKYVDQLLFLDKGSGLKTISIIGNNEIDEKRILLENNVPSKHRIPEKKQFEETAFELRHVSTYPGENISLQIKRGEIAVILDLSNSYNENLINAISGKAKYSGEFLLDDKTIRNLAKKKLLVYIANYKIGEVVIKSLDLKDNLALSIFPRISHLGFFNIRQKNQIMIDFLKIYQTHNINYEFEVQNLSQQEEISIFVHRIRIQKWKLLIFTNPEILFSYETASIIKEQLRQMTENGRTICIFTSTLEPYAHLADYFYIIENGKVQGKYTYEECHKRFGLNKYNLND